MCVLTIFGFAGAVVWLHQVTLHTGAGVGALSVSARLTASPVHVTLIEIYKRITQCIHAAYHIGCVSIQQFSVLGNQR